MDWATLKSGFRHSSSCW